jgi:hypothetical protein
LKINNKQNTVIAIPALWPGEATERSVLMSLRISFVLRELISNPDLLFFRRLPRFLKAESSQ